MWEPGPPGDHGLVAAARDSDRFDKSGGARRAGIFAVGEQHCCSRGRSGASPLPIQRASWREGSWQLALRRSRGWSCRRRSWWPWGRNMSAGHREARLARRSRRRATAGLSQCSVWRALWRRRVWENGGGTKDQGNREQSLSARHAQKALCCVTAAHRGRHRGRMPLYWSMERTWKDSPSRREERA
jgi:hypothetical protein